MLADADVWALYRQVSEEYNRTPLAHEGWVHEPDTMGFMELRAIAKHLPERGLLVDIGTGKGIGPRFAVKLGARAISVDSPAAAGTSALENVRLAGVEAHACDVLREPLPLADSTADCVLFADVIEHLIHSPKRVLREIHRVLKPGGVCIATTPNAVRLSVRVKVLLGHSNWPAITDFYEASFHGGHHHEYTPEEFKLSFTAAGFAIHEFVLYEGTLRSTRLSGLSDLQSRSRSRDGEVREPLAVTLGKKALLAITAIAPRLRSSMLLIARK